MKDQKKNFIIYTLLIYVLCLAPMRELMPHIIIACIINTLYVTGILLVSTC